MLIIFFILGLFAGSFVNCVVYRIENNKSFVKERSFCPKCGKTLNWIDLIPVLGFLILRGKCRYCNQKISIHYPIIEIIVGILFVLFYFNIPPVFLISNIIEVALSLIIFTLLVIIFIYDFKHFIIPNIIVYPAIVFSLLRLFFLFPLNSLFLKSISPYLLSGLGAALFFLSIFLISRGKWIGFGDVKLGLLMGLFLGFPNILLAFFLSFFFGGIIGVIMIILRLKEMKSEVPFAPFLIFGLFLSYFWGERIIDWYLRLL